MIILLSIIAYLIGSFSGGILIGKHFYQTDIRDHGSKNIGATNAGRILGRNVGLLVSIFDVAKVLIPTAIARKYLNLDQTTIVGMCAMLGHCFPIYHKFKGGKGVSSYLGIIFGINLIFGIILVIIWKLLKCITNYVSISSMITCFFGSFSVLYYTKTIGTTFFLLLIASFLVVYLHRTNIKRLINGTENKVRK